MTTCPSGVHYMHLVDHARAHIEKTYRRPLSERLMRRLLATVLPQPGLFRAGSDGGRRGAARWPALLPARLAGDAGAGAGADSRRPSPCDRPQVIPAEGTRRKRVALLTGCAQQVLNPAINEATIRLLTRHGVEVVVPRARAAAAR